MTIFRAIWPIADPDMPFAALVTEAQAEIPALLRRAKANLDGRGRFTVARSVDVPGSGRITEWTLIYTAPATAKAPSFPPGGAIPDGRTRRDPDDIDPVIVDRLLLLQRVPDSTRAEKCEAMRRWLASGGTEKALCDAHGWGSSRYVAREVAA